MFAEFFRWWKDRLVEIAGLSNGSDPAARGDAVLVGWNGVDDPSVPGVLSLHLRRGGKLRPLPQRPGQPVSATITRTKLLLQVPDSFLLERRVELPLAVARDPEGAMRFEMDRLTPFLASEVVSCVHIETRDRARGQLVLLLSLVPRARITPAVAALARLGLSPTYLSFAGTVRPCLPFDASDPARVRRGGFWVPALTGLAALLALCAIGLPFARQSLEEARLDDRIAQLRPALAELDRLRAKAKSLGSGEGGDIVATERAQAGDPLTVLSSLTELLPDDTYLLEFAMAGRQITMHGQSAASARLIERLARQPDIADPTFAAPVTRVEGGKSELFAIRAKWRQAP
jgi:general secretion pathway protein L